MMSAFMTSAPGKVIVYGEHAVVFGKAAMAAAVSLRSYLLVTTLSKTHRTITLRFPDIGFSDKWEIDALPWSIFSHPSKKKFYYDLVTSLDPELVEALQPHLAKISAEASAENTSSGGLGISVSLPVTCLSGLPRMHLHITLNSSNRCWTRQQC